MGQEVFMSTTNFFYDVRNQENKAVIISISTDGNLQFSSKLFELFESEASEELKSYRFCEAQMKLLN